MPSGFEKNIEASEKFQALKAMLATYYEVDDESNIAIVITPNKDKLTSSPSPIVIGTKPGIEHITSLMAHDKSHPYHNNVMTIKMDPEKILAEMEEEFGVEGEEDEIDFDSLTPEEKDNFVMTELVDSYKDFNPDSLAVLVTIDFDKIQDVKFSGDSQLMDIIKESLMKEYGGTDVTPKQLKKPDYPVDGN